MPHAFAQSTVTPQRPDDPGYAVLHAAATAPLQQAFGGTIALDVERLDRLGRWVFVMGTMRTPDGERPSYAATPYAARAASGGMSDTYVALLRADAGNADVPRDVHDHAGATSADDTGERLPTVEADAADAADVEDAPSLSWTVLDYAIGPADVAWLAWPERHAAPRHLFGF